MKVGFPRPWSEDYGVPTPYTAESDFAVASASDTRVNRCIVKGLCAVCGEKLDEEMYVAIFNYSEEHKNVGDITDHGMSHEKCAKIVMSFCPFFKTKDAYYVKVLTKPVLALYRKQKRLVDGWYTKRVLQEDYPGTKIPLEKMEPYLIKEA